MVEKDPEGHKTLKVAKNNNFTFLGWFFFCGSEQPSEINVWVQFRVSFSFTLLQKKVLFCRFSRGHAKSLP